MICEPDHEQASQQMAGVLAPAIVGKSTTGQIGQTKSIVEFAIGEQSGVGSDPAAVEFQLQAAVEIDP